MWSRHGGGFPFTWRWDGSGRIGATAVRGAGLVLFFKSFCVAHLYRGELGAAMPLLLRCVPEARWFILAALAPSPRCSSSLLQVRSHCICSSGSCTGCPPAARLQTKSGHGWDLNGRGISCGKNGLHCQGSAPRVSYYIKHWFKK